MPVLFAQTSGKLIEQSLSLRIPFTVTQYSTKQGLPQSQVLNIIPKKNGNLLLSTVNGIVEFNGIEFKPVIKDDAYKAHIYTKLMLHEKTGQLFGKELEGPAHLLVPGYKMINKCRASCIQKDSIFCIDTYGNIYAAGVQTLAFTKIAKTHINKPTSLFAAGDVILIGSSQGVVQYNIKNKTHATLLSDVVLDFKLNPYNKAVYIICSQSIYKKTAAGVNNVCQLNKQYKNIIINDIEFTDEDVCFVATTLGLFRVSGSHTGLYSLKDALPTQYVQSLYYNKAENCLFAGTGDKGLLKLQFKNCYSFSSEQGFSENASLSSVIKTRAGDVLVCAKDGIYKIDKDTAYLYSRVTGLYASLAEINDTICAGTWGAGIKLIKNNQLAGMLTPPGNLQNGHILSVFQDAEKKIWVGTDGISRGSCIKNIAPYLPGKINGCSLVFYELKNKNICIGGTKGVFILNKNGEIIKRLSKADGLQGKEVRSFYEDSEGKLWIGTYGGGLYCYYNNQLTGINQLKNAKLDADVFCMAKDNLGYIYITSNHGLWRLKEKDLDDFYNQKLDYLVPFYYGEETGILNTEFNGGFQNNYLKTKAGHFYFPSIQGLVLVKPEKPCFRKRVPGIEQVLVDDTISNFSNKTFKRSTYSIQFDFSSVNLLNKYNVYYQYKLSSDEHGSWSPLQKSTSVSFKMLPPNSYTFYLRAIDASMDRDPLTVKFEFEILPYFYETTWFKILFAVVFLSLSLLVVRIRMNRYRRKAKEQERIKRELAELELKAVQAQMNPHFIFNSLNSIKHYLFINDTKSADVFIDNFSILLRDFLEYSNKDFITLEKEAEMLASYLALESMRMNPPFRYTIILPAELNKIKIPTLLFQAFAENAVKHGITHASKACEIHIGFKMINGAITGEITDDGIGRKRSGEINQSRIYHTSKGINIVNEKIKIIKATHNIHVEFEIQDRVDADNNPLGTSVTIKIPVNKND